MQFASVVVLLLIVLPYSRQPAVADPPPPVTSSQGTEAQAPAVPDGPLDVLSPSVANPARFYHIPGSALTPVNSSTTLTYDGMGCVHATAGATYLLNAPLEIPDKSRLNGLRVYYDDTSATESVYGWITRYNAAGTDYEDLVAVPSLGSSGHGSNYVNLDHIVDTYNYSYVLVARLNVATSALQICGLRVMYYLPPKLYLPLLIRK
jgi:hypothetical protein